MINILKQKDITRFYDILDINGGNILTKNKRISVYRVMPCRVINRNLELEQQIYTAYVATIKMITFNYQIIIETKRINFNIILNSLNNNIHLSNDYMHRKIIAEYKEYLENLSSEINVYDRYFYFVTEALDMEKERRLKEGFGFLESIGVRIERLVNNEEIFRLTYELINKIEGENVNDNR